MHTRSHGALTSTRTEGPGRLALRLFLDLQAFDPLFAEHNGYCLSAPQHFHQHTLPRSKHTHNFIFTKHHSLNADQTYDEWSNDIMVICSSCRLAVRLQIQTNAFTNRACGPGNLNYPCHHFILQELTAAKLTSEVLAAKPNSWVDKRTFVCSAESCGLIAEIKITPPVITPDDFNILVSEERIAEALKIAQQEDPEKYPPNSVVQKDVVFNSLRSYLWNLAAETPRNIPRANRKYVVSLGEQCQYILEKFGYQETVDKTELRRKAWMNQDDKRLLALAITETDILLSTITTNLKVELQKRNAEILMRRLLGCDVKTYGKQFGITTGIEGGDLIDLTSDVTNVIDLTQENESPWYRCLGASRMHSDSMIRFAFNRQSYKDPFHRPMFYESFQNIARDRNSESLQIEVATMLSKGEITQTELDQAYAVLNIDSSMDDDMVIVMFQSALDADPSREEDLRKAGLMIAKFRQSKAIEKAAEKPIKDLAHAYRHLDCTEHMEDEWVVTNYTVKAAESEKDIKVHQEALKMIGEARKSESLIRFWKESTGQVERGPPPMSIEEAYAIFGANAETSDELLIATFRINGKGNQRWEKALAKIAEVRNSQSLQHVLGLESSSENPTGTRRKDWPVGIENIGNTCYLNSLLQFYYTIKPLREVVLDFNKYQEDEVTEELLAKKTIGGRKLSAQEIDRAKRFVAQLRTLFENLGSSDQSSITPDKELAYLALVSSKDEISQPETITIDDMPDLEPLLGPELPQLPEDPSNNHSDPMDVDSADSTVKDAASVHSEATLIGDEFPGAKSTEDQSMTDTIIEAKPVEESLIDLKTPVAETAEVQIDAVQPVLEKDADVSMINASQVQDAASVAPIAPVAPVGKPTSDFEIGNIPIILHDESGIIEVDSDYERQGSPKRVPPPIPPRPKPARPKTVEFDSFMFGRQQDVTECIENVMFQLEAAMKGEPSEEESGEQHDIVKQLFYGKCKQYLEISNEKSRVKEDMFSHLIVNVADGNKDIYQALDGFFDAEKIELDGKEARRYQTISELPQILQIQIQRVQFDRKTNRTYKSEAQLSFPETIYLDRYCEAPAESSLAQRRVEAWRWKEELANLAKRRDELKKPVPEANVSDNDAENRPRKRLKLDTKGLDMADTFSLGSEFLKATQETGIVELPPDLIDALDEESAGFKKELEDVEERIKSLQSHLVQQFTDLRKHAYRVQSIFIHRGTATAGHYWIYIYDFHDKKYRKYNDGYVDVVKNEAEVLEGRDSATPYLLVFIREDLVDDIAEAVRRESCKRRKFE